jgi:hypothetical protein
MDFFKEKMTKLALLSLIFATITLNNAVAESVIKYFNRKEAAQIKQLTNNSNTVTQDNIVTKEDLDNRSNELFSQISDNSQVGITAIAKRPYKLSDRELTDAELAELERLRKAQEAERLARELAMRSKFKVRFQSVVNMENGQWFVWINGKKYDDKVDNLCEEYHFKVVKRNDYNTITLLFTNPFADMVSLVNKNKQDDVKYADRVRVVYISGKPAIEIEIDTGQIFNKTDQRIYDSEIKR